MRSTREKTEKPVVEKSLIVPPPRCALLRARHDRVVESQLAVAVAAELQLWHKYSDKN